MNDILVENWNKIVKPDDNVYHMGDFAFKSQATSVLNFIARLHGNIYLIIGNHEKDALNAYRNPVGRKNFVWARHYEEAIINDQLICMFHYPLRSWHWIYRGTWHLFGHEHGNFPSHQRSVDVGVDNVHKIIGVPQSKDTFRPLHFDELKEFMDKQPIGSHGNIPACKIESTTGKYTEDAEEGKET